MNSGTILTAFAMGAFATLVMDVLNYLTARTGLVGQFRPALLGRWVSHMPRGHFAHQDIRTVPPVKGELVIGELAHYTIGGTLAIFYIGLAHLFSFPPESPVRAITYATATTVLPWFLMFPAWGFGLLGKKGPSRMTRSSVYNQLNFGIGIALFLNFLV